MPLAPEMLLLKPAAPQLRPFVCALVALVCLTCDPATTATKSDEDEPPPPPPQCILSYLFVDAEGEEAFICVYDDTSVRSWHGYGATVFHPYLDGYLVGLVIDLPTLCSGDIPVCMVDPWDQCVAPLQTWSAEDTNYALCRTNNGDDIITVYSEGRRDTWYVIESWGTSIVCMD